MYFVSHVSNYSESEFALCNMQELTKTVKKITLDIREAFLFTLIFTITPLVFYNRAAS